MALQAMCMPILPGKKDKWLEMMKQVSEGDAAKEFKASRESLQAAVKGLFLRWAASKPTRSCQRKSGSRIPMCLD